MREFLSSLVFLSLSHLSAAQFGAYPPCVQPLLNRNFPLGCLSLSLAAQNTCLCQHANAFGSALVTAVYQSCGCGDLKTTNQLTEAYCNQVGIDIGPAFDVFVQDNTNCGSGSGSSASAGSGGASNTGNGGATGTVGSGSSSTGTGGGIVTVTQQSSGTNGGGGTVTVIQQSSSTSGGGATVTVIQQSSGTGSAGGTSSSTGTSKTSAANSGLVVERLLEIVIGLVGGILAL